MILKRIKIKPLILVLIILNIIGWHYYLYGYTEFYNNIFSFSKEEVKELKVVFFNAGSSDVIFIKTPTGKNILIDPGKGVKETLFLYFKSHDIYAIDTLIVTEHTDEHLGESLILLKNIPVGEVIDIKKKSDNKSYRQFSYFLKYHPEIGYKKVLANSNISVDPFLELKVLYPFKSTDEITGPLVMKLTYDDISFLFTSNIDEFETVRLTNFKEYLHATFMKYPNHNKGISYPFILFSKPDNIIINEKIMSDFSYINPEVWDNAAFVKSNVHLYETGESLEIITDGTTWRKIRSKI